LYLGSDFPTLVDRHNHVQSQYTSSVKQFKVGPDFSRPWTGINLMAWSSDGGVRLVLFL